ncbi:helix-turn-helix domain-containing protein [Pseudomonas sp.]|uniref:helix-turn-helix domain-containing protein n=1 Tax=Pseudomonas sp. TaxID=306 RepID=UPI0028AB8882|nr:helix-turn-helix domain-containing protein [Pseudomonas sp.]
MSNVQPEAVMSARGNPGDILRQARISNGWSIAQVAAQMNLSGHVIELLEAGDYQKLPGHTFARGYVRSYGKLLGLDQAELVKVFDQYTGTDAKGSTVHTINRVEEPVRLSRNVLRIVSFILVVVIIGLGLFWWQERSGLGMGGNGLSLEHVEVESADGTTEIHTLDEPEDQAVAEAQKAEVPAASELGVPATPTAPAANAVAQTPVPAANTASGAAANGAANAAPAAASTLTTPVVSTDAALAPTTPPAGETAPAAGQGGLSIQLVADCWMQITDASGKVIYSGLKRKGDTLQFETVKAPVEIRLGYARGAQITYNGQPVDIKPYVRGETARFKVGQASQ